MKNYFNYDNIYEQLNNLNQMFGNTPVVNPQMPAMNNNLFEPYQGFIRGNMFKNLYKPYKTSEPYRINPANEQAQILTQIDALEFACIDLNLYLDINENDRSAIDLFNQYRLKKRDLIKEYETKFGPLTTSSDVLERTPWMWDDRPWPWQR